jgi:hypothetical protein
MGKDENKNLFENTDFETRNNFVGFWALLLKIDKRVNPQLYKNKINENYDNNRNTNITHKAQ